MKSYRGGTRLLGGFATAGALGCGVVSTGGATVAAPDTPPVAAGAVPAGVFTAIAVPLTTISTRRFSCRPAADAFEAIGSASP